LAAPCAVYLDAVTNIKLIGERRLKTSDSLIIGYTTSCTHKVGGDKILLPKLGYRRSSGTNDDYFFAPLRSELFPLSGSRRGS
jgi:hypothetical protein